MILRILILILVLFFGSASSQTSSLIAGEHVSTSSRVEATREKIEQGLRHEFTERGLEWGAPIFIRIFKESSELELWVAAGDTFTLFRTYPICRWSGTVGPKTTQGDNQCPEGFYFVPPGRLNPNSQFHLSFDLGYPNAYERSLGWTGGALMVHGNCVSIGCYAMTDPGIEEIYIVADAALRNRQPFFRVHAFPFRMTPERMTKAEGSRWYSFWSNLREGYKYFERNKRPPNVEVRSQRYVFEDKIGLINNTETYPKDLTRIIHVFVALADDSCQGIIPIRRHGLGDGRNPRTNLYWGALYGLKTYFNNSFDWDLIDAIKNLNDFVLERCVFKNKNTDVYLVADAYEGCQIRQAVIDFLYSSAGYNSTRISIERDSDIVELSIYGATNLLAYVGHNGLMDFNISDFLIRRDDVTRDAIVLACASKFYFNEALSSGGANPILWTAELMAPEAYALKGAIDGWILNESCAQIRMRAARAYSTYQGCSLNAALRLMITGF